MSTLPSQALRPPSYAERRVPVVKVRTWLCRENAHQAREEAVHGAQDFGVPARHAGGDPALQRLEAAEDGRGLEDG